MPCDLHILNPATGVEIASLEPDSPSTIAAKLMRARVAQPVWAEVPLAARERPLARFGELLLERRDALAATLTSEVGKPITQARAEITSTVDRVRYFVEHARGVLATEEVHRDTAQGLVEEIAQEPLGVVANISAWNYPYFVGSNVFVPALLAGNAVLYKPSEHASLTGRAIVALLHEAGVPVDAIALVLGDGRAGATLIEQPVDGVFFTGSHATGQRIASRLAGSMIRLQLELGGKDPIYVCDDAPLEAAAAACADGAFYNAGQSCCAVERIYVERPVFARFVDAFLRAVRGFRIGDPTDPETYLGPLARAAQLEVLERQVADALARGARLVCGGGRPPGPGNFFEPTVLVDVDHSMLVMREESFGPLIGIQPCDGDDEAIRLMSDTEYGLTAGVYGQSEERARRILSRVNTGTVYWNCCDRVTPRLPWSGRGHSGIGTTLGREGIRTFVRPKAWHLKRPPLGA